MCGIFGIAAKKNGRKHKNVISEIILGLYDLQHRGEQGCGAAVSDGKNLSYYRDEGLVTEVFSEKNRRKITRKLQGNLGIGHTLYSTVGRTGQRKQTRTFQPLIGKFQGETFALAHNGNLVGLSGLRKKAKEAGYRFKSEVSDTEVIVALLSISKKDNFVEALKEVLPKLKGAFALVILYKDKIIGVRDRHGIRPLCVGRNAESTIIASESCAFYTLGARFIREIQPGEVIILDEQGIKRSFKWTKDTCLKFCIFELIYFARPDSRLCCRSVYSYRNNAGLILAKEQSVDADIVVPVPESGRIYDDAYASEIGIPVREGLFRNRHVATKTFLTPRNVDRKQIQRRKIHPLKDVVYGKRICLIEDSLVRAVVCPETVAMCREAGAVEVHVRIGSAPICCPCFLGIDMATKEELAASDSTVEEIRKRVRSDSLGYLSIEGMVKATGLPKENLCLGCFNGQYPIELSR